MGKKGFLLINVGSPRSTSPDDVGEYLKEFLMDKEIISLPFLFRFFLVHGLIVPKRKFSSAEKYKLIWTEKGSPLVTLTESFAKKLADRVDPGTHVVVGMRYGTPSIPEALQKMRQAGVTEILVCPLFPQFARATVASGGEYFEETLKSMNWDVPYKVLPPFYDKKGFIHSFRDQVQAANLPKETFYLFSFHGLPEKQIRQVKGCLANPACCDTPKPDCYRSQAVRTAHLLAESLGLSRDQWTYSFQSRLGRAKWIEPYTDNVIEELKSKNIKSIAVVCPSFVTDCLETLEEIGTIPGIKLIPCPNDSDTWVDAFHQLLNS